MQTIVNAIKDVIWDYTIDDIDIVADRIRKLIESDKSAAATDAKFRKLYDEGSFRSALEAMGLIGASSNADIFVCASCVFSIRIYEEEDVMRILGIVYGEDEDPAQPTLRPPWMRNYCPSTYQSKM